jgi:hypothetical protein
MFNKTDLFNGASLANTQGYAKRHAIFLYNATKKMKILAPT